MPFEIQILQLEKLHGLIRKTNTNTFDEALTLLDMLRPQVNDNNSGYAIIEMLIFEAQLLNKCGRRQDALHILEHALRKAEPEGFVRIFADEGEPVRILLRAVQSRGIKADYINKLLTAFGINPTMGYIAQPTHRLLDDEIEPLSEHELEVLRFIAYGASNREIAETLIVSLGTVKKHLNNIFLKLDSHNRTQAVTTARQHNLL